MHNVDSTPSAAVSRSRQWPLLLTGILLFFLGPALYFVQLHLKHLDMPWHMPLLASAGVVLLIVSVRRRRGVARMLVLVSLTIICGLEWFFLLVGTTTPVYTGPAQVGRKVPEFTASLADGTPFTQKDLENGSATLLLFFRGRW